MIFLFQIYYVQEELIKYPTHDLLVKPSLDDLVLSSRPYP